MMKKSILSVFTLFLTTLLCISALFIPSFATSDAPDIAHTALDFEDGKIRILFSVDTEGLADGESAEIRFFASQNTSQKPEYIAKPVGEITLDGKSYSAIYSDVIFPQNIRKPLYAALATTDKDGKLITLGELETYSIFEHAVALIDNGGDQTALFKRLLDYGAAMQKVLTDSGAYRDIDLKAAGGYIDEYCAIKINVAVDGVIASTSTYYYNEGERVELIAAREFGDAIFEYFTSADGDRLSQYGEDTARGYNKLTVTADKPGYTEYTENYVTAKYADVITFDEHTAISDYGIVRGTGTRNNIPLTTTVDTDKKGVASTTDVICSAFITITSRNTGKYLNFEKVIKATTATSGYAEDADTTGAYKTGDIVTASPNVENTTIFLKNTAKNDGDDLYIFECDLYAYGEARETLSVISMQNSSGNDIFSLKLGLSGNSITLKTEDGTTLFGDATLKKSVWHTVRIEYSTTAEGYLVKSYLNGKLTGEGLVGAAATNEESGERLDGNFGGIFVRHLDDTRNVCLHFDNLIIASAKK